MNLKKIISFGLLLSICLSTLACFASTADSSDIYSLINSEEFTKVNEPILFEAQSFSNTENKELDVKYSWDFGNQNFDQGTKVVHRYKKAGKYTVQLTTEDSESTQTTSMKEIFVSKTNILLLTDHISKKDSIEQFKKTAESFGVFVNIKSAYNSPSSNIASEIILQKFPNKQSIANYEYIIDWTKGGLSKEVLQKYRHKFAVSANNVKLLLIESNTGKKFTDNDKRLLGASEVEFAPVPAIIGIRLSAYLIVCSIILRCSLTPTVADSPVVPTEIMELVPESIWKSMRLLSDS